MAGESPPASVFTIEDSDDDDLTSMQGGGVSPDAPFLESAAAGDEQTHSLLFHHATDRAVGTVGCCGAVCLSSVCLCCGMCRDEFVETYNRFTLCGMWWPLRAPQRE
jgi:hypothetical protein